MEETRVGADHDAPSRRIRSEILVALRALTT
jgi:hypothetical protein